MKDADDFSESLALFVSAIVIYFIGRKFDIEFLRIIGLVFIIVFVTLGIFILINIITFYSDEDDELVKRKKIILGAGIKLFLLIVGGSSIFVFDVFSDVMSWFIIIFGIGAFIGLIKDKF